uniref:Uncharacterized protein n=1 Tax=viral metagenome TaxID=1070528 RepID=A0A6C0HJL5_9ZZZZ
MTKPFEGFTVPSITQFKNNPLKTDGTFAENGVGPNEYPGNTKSSDDFLSQQDKLIAYTGEEVTRLQISNQNLEQDYARMDMIRRSEYPKRNKYIWVLAIFIAIGVVVFVSFYLQNVLNVKSGWIDLILVLIVASLLIAVIIIFLDINDRDRNDFSKLKPNGSKLIQINETNYAKSLTNISDTDMTNKGCRGKECCGPGSSWDDDLKACKTT